MSLLAIAFWLLNVVLDTIGHLAFKAAAITEHETEWQRWRQMLAIPVMWLGIACFVLEFLVWLALLSLVPLSLAMLIGSINVVAVMLAGNLLFDERLDRMRVAGMWLITLGVALAGGGGLSTRRFYFFGFGTLLLFDTLTQVSFKLATTHAGEFSPQMSWLLLVAFDPWIYGAVLGYMGAFVTWMTLLRHAPIGPAFAASHLEVLTVLIISVLIFGEHLSLTQIFGGFSIILGIICLSLSKAEHPDA